MPLIDPFVSHILETGRAQLEALRGRTVLVGVSGGADSVALLHVLLHLSDSFSMEIHAAHFDHSLRPESADHAAQVARYVASLAAPLASDRQDVQQFARERHLSIEAAAREMRYRFLAATARELGATVVTGHNQNDQAETVLLNLVRGSGLTGLTGMRPVGAAPRAPDVPLVRPLLAIGAQEIRDYCVRHSLRVLDDPSNLSLEYTRNRLRHTVLPELEGLNTQAVAHIAATAEALYADEAALTGLARSAYRDCAAEYDRAVVLAAGKLAGAPRAIQVRVLRLAVLHVAGTLEGITRAHLLALMDLLLGVHGGRSFSGPRGLSALDGADKLLIWRGDEMPDHLYPLPLLESAEGAPARLSNGWRWEARPCGNTCGQSAPGTQLHEHIRCGEDEVRLRQAYDHERFQPLGMAREKRVMDFLADARAPRSVRQRVPVVDCGGEIVWVVGWRIDDRWKLRSSDDPYVCLRVWRSEEGKGGRSI